MEGCSYKDRCEFYSDLSRKLGMVFFFKTRYCHSPGHIKCARYIFKATTGIVPPDLYPTQTWRIQSVIKRDANPDRPL